MSVERVSHVNLDVREMHKERQKAKLRFGRQGMSIIDWSLERRYNPALVRGVLDGRYSCIRGQSHKIAVELGLKPAPETV